MSAKDHYETHLGRIYSWMIGDFEDRKSDQKNFFKQNQILPRRGSTAVDLGAGNGIQSLALAEMGFEVLSIDFNVHLLDQLKSQCNGLNVKTVEADIRNIDKIVPQQVALIVCMGDTITHLDSKKELELLLKNCADKLEADGKLVISYRDLSSEEVNSRKFIPVKSDESRILTCMLEFFEGKVRVTDLIYEKQDAKWQFSESSYFKLILPSSEILALCGAAGLKHTKTEMCQGMIYILAQKR